MSAAAAAAELRELLLTAAYSHGWRRRTGRVVAALDRAALAATAPSDAPPEDVAAAIDAALAAGELVDLGVDGLEVAHAHRAWAKAAATARLAQRFGAWMVRAEASAAYRAFTRVANQLDLVLFDMMDPPQVAAAVHALAVGPGARVLDLGCGIGSLTEHLAERTGARFDGVDFADLAIARATERVGARLDGLADRLSFAVADLDVHAPPAATYDAIVAFDTLYFVEDLDRLVRAVRDGLRPGGRFVAFWSAIVPDGVPDADVADRLSADGTLLAHALRAAGLGYTAADFTAEELAHWRRTDAELARCEAAFDAEGNRAIWAGRRAETDRVLARCEARRSQRWLYTAVR